MNIIKAIISRIDVAFNGSYIVLDEEDSLVTVKTFVDGYLQPVAHIYPETGWTVLHSAALKEGLATYETLITRLNGKRAGFILTRP